MIASHLSTGKLVHRRNKLDAGIVDQDVDTDPNSLSASATIPAISSRFEHVGRRIGTADTELGFDRRPGSFRFHRRHQDPLITTLAPFRGESTGTAKADPRGRSGHDGGFVGKHAGSPLIGGSSAGSVWPAGNGSFTRLGLVLHCNERQQCVRTVNFEAHIRTSYRRTARSE